MKDCIRFPWKIVSGAFICMAVVALGCAHTPVPGAVDNKDTLYQISTIDALLSGVFDGTVRCNELVRHGDTGLGTFNALDGEMVVLDGVVYQVPASGQVRRPAPETQTPFAAVTHFEADGRYVFKDVADFEDFRHRMQEALPAANLFYAIRIGGEFERIRTRSVRRQMKPYPPLAEAVKDQPEFEFENVRGDIVGFYCPAFAAKLNVTGLHLHFLDESRTRGGHLLDLAGKEMVVELDETAEYRLALPASGAFRDMEFNRDTERELEAIER